MTEALASIIGVQIAAIVYLALQISRLKERIAKIEGQLERNHATQQRGGA